MAQATLTVDLGETLAAVKEMHALAGTRHRWPRHIRDRVAALTGTTAPLADGWLECEPGADGAYHMRPAPRLLALMADIRAQGV